MKVYRVSKSNGPAEGHDGYEYYTSKVEAYKRHRQICKEQDEDPDRWPVDSLEFPLTKKGVLWAITAFGSHPDNG